MLRRLDAIGLEAGTDKSSSHHDYLSFYEIFFAPLREEKITILEVGVYTGASLKTWEDYFPNATIVGVDITPGCKRFERGRTRIVLADQSNIEELTSLAIEHGPFDLIIEDGSHMCEHQITSLRTLFPFVKPNGIYIVEDLQTNYGSMLSSYQGIATTTCVEYLKRWVDLRVGDDQVPIEEVEDAFLRTYGREIEFITFYRRACLIKKRFTAKNRGNSPGEPLAGAVERVNLVRLTMVAHVSGLGDLLGPEGFINPGQAYGFQGMVIESEERLVEYRVRSSDGSWSEWTEQGNFAGTRGQSILLTGFAARLTPLARARYRLTTFGRFVGSERLVVAGNGEDCVSHSRQTLCGAEILISKAD
jgi:hypothetical protein